ncbi:MAG: UbiH/UbiF family hydroxylase [Hyphomicrobiaceae bacterium]|nr:UbiH/UbiF family hydroxylase [Hyphomicrobiaceae bacterium]
MSDTAKMKHYDVAIIGAGATGLTAACAMAEEGLEIVCFDKSFGFEGEKKGDTRTIALLQNSVYLLQNISVWEKCLPFAEPLNIMKVVDDTGRFPPVPSASFKASELGPDPFGYNIPNDRLVSALAEHAATSSDITLSQTKRVVSIKNRADKAIITPVDGNPVSASLVVGADGAHSLARAQAGIKTNSWNYNQTAIACWFEHSLPHQNISTEFHRKAGPLVVVPMQGNKCGLVWVETPANANRLMDLDEAEFARQLKEAVHGSLGTINKVSRRSAFPLSGLVANRFAKGRTVLVGHAAHVLPPIGAQGLNLGLRDAAMIADIAGKAFIRAEDLGGAGVIAEYDRQRRSDIMSRTFAVDFLNRTLLHGWFPPLQATRAIGVGLLKLLPPLRKAVMREGIAPQRNLPPLMYSR